MGSSQHSRPYMLATSIQNYAWGMRNEDAFIARLLNIDPPQDEPFAELWIGTHSNGPSQLIDPHRGPVDLGDWIAEDPENRLSLNRAARFTEKLPYLFKVLSAGQMLSIQTHPNKAQAEKLHVNDPAHYPDDNHKPELAIAIDALDALVGFISEREFQALLNSTPELRQLLRPTSTTVQLKDAVLELLELWENSPQELKSSVKQLCERIASQTHHSATEALLLQQSRIYGTEDIGLFFILLLNRVHLEAGEAVFLGPGISHAYLKGNIIECMANSDNVVRLGLTGKYTDPTALREVLDFRPDPKIRVQAETDGCLTHYPTPSSEFRVKSLALDEGQTFEFRDREDLTLFLVLQGEIKLHWTSEDSSCCSFFDRGDSFITPAQFRTFTLQASVDSLVYFVELP